MLKSLYDLQCIVYHLGRRCTVDPYDCTDTAVLMLVHGVIKAMTGHRALNPVVVHLLINHIPLLLFYRKRKVLIDSGEYPHQ